jgi:hypothetical protein
VIRKVGSALSYKILGLCRGNGKGYVKILTEGVAAGRLYATATAENGTTLACAAYEMSRSGEDRDVAIRAGAMLAGTAGRGAEREITMRAAAALAYS